jgi:hypothetical protein
MVLGNFVDDDGPIFCSPSALHRPIEQTLDRALKHTPRAALKLGAQLTGKLNFVPTWASHSSR